MQHIIHRSVVITLEIVPAGMDMRTAERATVDFASAWFQAVGQCLSTMSSMPAYQISMRQVSPEQGVHIQILLCWFVLKSHRWENDDFEPHQFVPH